MDTRTVYKKNREAMKKILFISGHSRKKNIYVLDKKGRKKNMIEKSVQKKKHNIDTKKKNTRSKTKKKKNVTTLKAIGSMPSRRLRTNIVIRHKMKDTKNNVYS